VTGQFHEQGSVLKGDAEGFCDCFKFEISIDSDEPDETVKELIGLAHRMCFTEKALLGKIQLEVIHLLNGKKLAR
jgi:organic hydroperoxide reductase OsmC/OhrA